MKSRYDDPEYQKQVSLQMLATPTHEIACRAIVDLRKQHNLEPPVRRVETELRVVIAHLTEARKKMKDLLELPLLEEDEHDMEKILEALDMADNELVDYFIMKQWI